MRTTSTFYIYLLFILLTITFSSCKSDSNEDPLVNNQGEVTDIDGNVYKTVTIGTQVWMAENLKTTKYRNGDPIPNITNGPEWNNLKTGAYCNYNNDIAISNKYGKYYNWYTVNDPRGIAPSGWHVPSVSEWETLEIYVSATLGTSGSVAKALAAKTDWVSSTNNDAPGNDLTKNNSSGFTGLPGGECFAYEEGLFKSIGYDGSWWSSSLGSNTNDAWNR